MENIVILGASRGLGAELAKLLSSQSNLMLVSRKLHQMEKLFSSPHKLYEMDLTQDSKWEELFQAILSFKATRIFYVAGGGPHGLFQNKQWKDHTWAFRLNFLCPAYLIYQCLKKHEIFQQFIYVGSDICEHSPDPRGASYAASKHAMKGLIKSIQQESPSFDLRLFSPGYMDTDMLPPNSKPRDNKLKLLNSGEVASSVWHWAQSFDGDRHKIIPSI